MLYTLWLVLLLLMILTAMLVTQRKTVMATLSPMTRLRSVTTTLTLSAERWPGLHIPPAQPPLSRSSPGQNSPPLAGGGSLQDLRLY